MAKENIKATKEAAEKASKALRDLAELVPRKDAISLHIDIENDLDIVAIVGAGDAAKVIMQIAFHYGLTSLEELEKMLTGPGNPQA